MAMIHGNHYTKLDGPFEAGKAISNAEDVLGEIDEEIEKVENSDALSRFEREDLLDKLYTAKEELTNISPDSISDYNNALEVVDHIERKRLEAERADGGQDVDGVTLNNVQKTGADKLASPSADSSDGEVSEALEDFDVEEMADRMMDDPQAAFEEINEMDFEDAQMAFNQLQMYMQQIQRMTKMMSNLTNMAHETESAVIGNIR